MKIIKKEEPLPPKNLMVILYGYPGVAKTSLSFTAENPLLIDFDRGVHRAFGRQQIFMPDLYEDVQEMIEKDELRDSGYKTVVIDTGGTCIDNFIADYVARKDFKNKTASGSLSLQGYGAAKVVFGTLVNYIRSCKMDLVVICHAVEKEGAGDTLRLRPKMTGGSYDILIAEADIMGFVEMLNGKANINFNPTERHVGKNSGEIPPTSLPHYTEAEWSTFLGTLIQKTKDKISALTEDQKVALDQIKTFTARVAAAIKPEEFTQISADATVLPDFAKLAVKKVMGDRLKEVGVVWNKEHLKFEKAPETKDPKTLTAGENKGEEVIQKVSQADWDNTINGILEKKKKKKAIAQEEKILLELSLIGVFRDKAYSALDDIQFHMKETQSDLATSLKYWKEDHLKTPAVEKLAEAK